MSYKYNTFILKIPNNLDKSYRNILRLNIINNDIYNIELVNSFFSLDINSNENDAFSFIENINNTLNNHENYIHKAERCNVYIYPQEAYIFDNFCEKIFDLKKYDDIKDICCKIKTAELKEIAIFWYNEVKKFNKHTLR